MWKVNSIMISWSGLPVRQKVYAYMTYQYQLLVFEPVDFLEAGIQVPGGTLGHDELPHEGAMRKETRRVTLNKSHLIVHREGFSLGFNGWPWTRSKL
jgi:hypothetical protein